MGRGPLHEQKNAGKGQESRFASGRCAMESASETGRPNERKAFGVGCWIWWNRLDRARAGPAQVWMLVLSHQRRWAYVEFEGNGVWVREDLITEVVQGSGQPPRAIEPLHGH